jgi:hypothetical protein
MLSLLCRTCRTQKGAKIKGCNEKALLYTYWVVWRVRRVAEEVRCCFLHFVIINIINNYHSLSLSLSLIMHLLHKAPQKGAFNPQYDLPSVKGIQPMAARTPSAL